MRASLTFVGIAVVTLLSVTDVTAQFLPPLLPDRQNVSHLPEISISLPSTVRSETVQGEYFLLGAFGGLGGYIKTRPDVVSYPIEASVKGTAATQVKVVLYADGCQTQKFVVSPKATSEVRSFDCEPLATVALQGVIADFSSLHANDIRVEFRYSASWVCAFFGLLDCVVPTFKVATVVPQRDGSFSVFLPDFTQDPNEHWAEPRFRGEFSVIVRENGTENIIAFLQPQDSKLSQNLLLQSSYPDIVRFEPKLNSAVVVRSP